MAFGEIHIHVQGSALDPRIQQLLTAMEETVASINDLRTAQGLVAEGLGAVSREVSEIAEAMSGLRAQLADALTNTPDSADIEAALAAADRLQQLAASLDAVAQDPTTEIPPADEAGPLDELPAVDPESTEG